MQLSPLDGALNEDGARPRPCHATSSLDRGHATAPLLTVPVMHLNPLLPAATPRPRARTRAGRTSRLSRTGFRTPSRTSPAKASAITLPLHYHPWHTTSEAAERQGVAAVQGDEVYVNWEVGLAGMANDGSVVRRFRRALCFYYSTICLLSPIMQIYKLFLPISPEGMRPAYMLNSNDSKS